MQAMSRILYSILILIAISSFFGCNPDDKYNTSHPKEGGIILTMDWSNVTSNAPSTYQAQVVYASGSSKVFNNLQGTTNNLIVEPGEATVFVYNEAEHISVNGKKASVNTMDGGIAANPGLFYSYSGKIFTERDKDISQNAVMNQQTGELKFSFAIKPASMIDKVKAVHAVLEGVTSEFDMQTGELSASSVIRTSLSKSSFYATSTFRLLGFDRSTKQNLKLDIELNNGNSTSVSTDLTSLVSDFNSSKNTLFTLNAELHLSGDNAPTVKVENWERNVESRYLSVSPLEIQLDNSTSKESIIITTDQASWGYSVVITGDWLTVTKSDDKLSVTASPNTNDTDRQATINISAGGLYESVVITQQRHIPVSDTYADEEVVTFQKATVGNGIDIVIMGDGYTINDMKKGTGKYEQDMRSAADHFFSVYPYNIYRNHFNVYMIAAISNEEGISNELTNKHVDNRFETIWEGGNSTGIDCNVDIVVDYLDAIPELDYAYIHDISVIMPINAYIYAGTCFMFYDPDNITDYANGFSICMSPVGRDFKNVLVHETGGHGFAKLADEYIYYTKEELPDDDRNKIIDLKKLNWYDNIDLSGDITQTSWKGFANLPKYSMVGTFEGSYTYGKGIWRPEFNSCMNDNVLYFNAPSRWAQVKRIKRLAGINYSFSQFLQDDVVPEYPATTRNYVEQGFIPLAPPVVKEFRLSRKRK